MCEDLDEKGIIDRLNSMVGRPYEPNGCMKFLTLALLEFGVQLTSDNKKDARLFRKVDIPKLGDVVLFKNLQLLEDGGPFHVGLMLDRRMCIQSSKATYGVGRIEITRSQIAPHVKAFYRPKRLCS